MILSDLLLAIGNLRAQATRTLLTALGIVFGVGSVIGMMSIGAGAREESLRFIEQLGVRNILIDSRPATSEEELQQRRRSSPGLTERDVRVLRANIEAIERSWGLLDSVEQRVLAQCSVFRRGFTPEAAEAVLDCDDHGVPVLDVLQSLREKSLLAAEPGEPVRLSLLESIRAYAARRLDERVVTGRVW